jgi:hypothetical protein
MVQVIEAEVKFPAGKSFTTKYGRQRQNVVFIANGEELTKWFDEGDRAYCALKKGEWVQLLRDGDKVSLIEPEPEPEAAAVPEPAARRAANAAPAAAGKAEPPAWKRTLYEQMKTRSDILAACHIEIHKRFVDERGQLIISEETLQKYATTIFISLKDSMK